MSHRALSGLLVVAIEQAVAAPLCTVRLADAGARVVKIERPEGETARNYDSAVKGTSAYFAWLNRGKESAVLNLKDANDLAILRAMLKQADVLVQNLAPGAMARLGLGTEILARDFPRLIVANILGYGQDTPCASMRAYDLLVQAESGICAVTGTPDTPCKIGVSAADVATGMNAHAAILEALIERSQTGKGKSIEVSMFDGMADWMSVPLLHYEHAGKETGRYGLSHSSIYPYGPFAFSDGTLIVAIQNNHEWRRFCEGVLDQPLLTQDERFASNALRVENRDALDEVLNPIFAALSLEEAIQKLQAHNVAWSRYTGVSELGRHPALRCTSVTLPDGETIDMPRPAARDNNFRSGPIPGIGEQTDAIRSEFASKFVPA